MKAKTLLFEVPNSHHSYNVRAFEDGSFKAYLIVHHDELHLDSFIDDYNMLPPSIRTEVKNFVTQVSSDNNNNELEIKKAG